MNPQPKPDDLLTSQDIQREYGLNPVVAETGPAPMIVTVERDRSAIAYLRGHILDLLYDRQDGGCFFCDQAMPEDYGSMHIHHEPPLSVRMPNGYGPATTMDQLRLTHPNCNLTHKKPRRKRG